MVSDLEGESLCPLAGSGKIFSERAQAQAKANTGKLGSKLRLNRDTGILSSHHLIRMVPLALHKKISAAC